MTFEMTVALSVLFVTLILAAAVIISGLIRVESRIMTLRTMVWGLGQSMAREPCGCVVAWSGKEEVFCAKTFGHIGDCAATLKDLERVGYTQAPF